MPYIQITIGQELSAPRKEKLKNQLGRLIPIIPGKTEPDLMVSIQDGLSLYMGGTEAPSVYIDLRVYTKTDPEAKKRFARELFEFITREFGIPAARQYLTIGEYEHWGYDGEFH
ncbi:MAG: hypothetical protein LBB78_05145 [Spirochaetaceae bacterium]|jgi:phenylpyruvate tautomerase PptA (4-oxalocrotonate tautomerase family)|nr:hypothetical protein [Spirochaetaceae bacterium]